MRFEVGQRVWEFNENRRVYRRNEKGRQYGSPIYAEHYRPLWIVAVEGDRYWVASGQDGRWWDSVPIGHADRKYVTDAEKDDAVFRADHRHRIADRVRDADTATLRKVAELIGYKPETMGEDA